MESSERIAREIEILGLKREAAEAAGAELVSYESEEMPLEMREAFLGNVVSYEQAGWVTHLKLLAEDGFHVTPPEELDDQQLPDALWALIRAMAAGRVYLYHTDHLSDRELYRWLWEEVLPEETKAMPKGFGWNCHLDATDCADADQFLRYYADEDEREHWLKHSPDLEMPPRETPPYDRDRLLPKPDYSRPRGGMEDELDEDEEWDEDD